MECETNLDIDFFKDLPLELRSKIFSYLDFKEIKEIVFVSWYFTDTIRYGQGSVTSIILPAAPKESYIFKTSQNNFYMNLITDRNNRPIQKLELTDDRPTYNAINWPIRSHSIINLYLSTPCSHILSLVEVLGPLYSLRELKFGFDTRLDINKLQCLADLTPNLQVLDIYFYHGLDRQYYTGKKSFNNLMSFRISTKLSDWFDWFRGDDYSPDSVISSFLRCTPNLSNLAVMGHFFQKEFLPSMNCVELLSNLNTLAIEIPGPNETAYSRYLPPINNNKFNELFIKAYSIYSALIPQINPLINIDTLYFDGLGCIHALEYYGISDNLRRLFLKPFSDLKDSKRITRLCKRCPNLEELIVLWFAAPVSWLVKMATVYCLKLRLVSFVTFAEEDDSYNIELLSATNNIKDIYLFKELPKAEANWLTDNGYNVYNGKNYGFDLFDRGINERMFLDN